MPIKTSFAVLTLTVLTFVAPGQARAAVILGQVQTFDDPDHHWVIGAGPVQSSPTMLPLALGGPGGPADPYLVVASTGTDGPQSRLAAQNFVEWSGDYVGAGIGTLLMDVRNSGPTDLYLRLLFLELGPAGPINGAFSAAPVIVSASSDWRTVAFDVTAPALMPLLGSVNGALSNASELRIFHNPDPFFVPGQNPAVAASLGVDNITASVPEPGTLALLAGTLVAFAGARARRGQRS